MPTNFAVLEIFPLNFLIWIVKYSFSKFSLASFNSLSIPLKEAREKFEKEYLTVQLKKFNGNISKTAKFVGMERSALHRKLKGLGIKEFN